VEPPEVNASGEGLFLLLLLLLPWIWGVAGQRRARSGSAARSKFRRARQGAADPPGPGSLASVAPETAARCPGKSLFPTDSLWL